jgi:acetyl esterase/lipase
VLIHGGFWRSAFSRRSVRPLADALVARNLAVWNIEYRRTGPAGGGGGWPATLEDVRAAIDHLGLVERADPTRVVAVGHSAGGQLALWAASGVGLDADREIGREGIRLAGVVSLAGVVDLIAAADLNLGHSAVVRFLGGSPSEVPDRYRAASPAALAPIGVRQLIIHGLDDSVVPSSMSARYASAAAAAGDQVDFVALQGIGHHEVIVPSGTPFLALTKGIEELAGALD